MISSAKTIRSGIEIAPAEATVAPTPATEPAFLRVSDMTKSFGSFVALKNIDFEIRKGEFVCFLGPSGCGKSTLLRIIAGLERNSSGRLLESGRDISSTSTAERRFGILFQSYALFPNLTVYDNVVYGLYKQMDRPAMQKRAAELLELVGLAGAGQKFPAQLSGGQQQRVALARAIAPSPRLLLLDEPLSALDAKVRVHLRRQIGELQRRLAVTTIMVTHDQEEALTLADRIVVMNQGTVEQIGTPTEIYYAPKTPFVANFVGKMNFAAGRLTNGSELRIGDTTFQLPSAPALPEGPVLACVRPEHIRQVQTGGMPAVVSHIEFLGAFWRVTLDIPALGEGEFVVDIAGGEGFSAPVRHGETIRIDIRPERLIVFPHEPGSIYLTGPSKAA